MYGTAPGTPPERILPTVGLNVGRMQVCSSGRNTTSGCISACHPCCWQRLHWIALGIRGHTCLNGAFIDNCALSLRRNVLSISAVSGSVHIACMPESRWKPAADGSVGVCSFSRCT